MEIDLKTYATAFIAALIGFAFYVFIVKLRTLSNRAKNANVKFSPIQYFKDDWIGLTTSIISIIAVIFVLDELAGYSEWILNNAKILFVFVGYTNTSFLLSLLSQADKRIQEVVDLKTNIADTEMTNYSVSKLNNINIAKELAEHGDEVFINDANTEFYTYTDIAANNLSGTVYTNTTISQSKADTLFLMTYDSVSGTYPIRRDRPIFPRRK